MSEVLNPCCTLFLKPNKHHEVKKPNKTSCVTFNCQLIHSRTTWSSP